MLQNMTQKIRNNWVLVAIAGAIVGVAILLAVATNAKAQPSSFTVQTTAAATTTLAYIGSGTATSTYQIDSGNVFSSSKVTTMYGIDSVYLYATVIASSSATVYTFTPQYSNNNIDWYNIGSQGTASAGGVVAVSTSTGYSWTPGTTATSSMTFRLPDYAELHQRILVSAAGAAGAVYMEIVLKKNPSTP